MNLAMNKIPLQIGRPSPDMPCRPRLGPTDVIHKVEVVFLAFIELLGTCPTDVIDLYWKRDPDAMNHMLTQKK